MTTRPASGDELLHEVVTNIWRTGLVHVLADRLPSNHDFEAQYSALAQEVFVHLSHDVHERSWGDHPREKWILVKSKSVKNGADKPRPFHTDEAGLRRPATLCLMYAEEAATRGGGNRYLSSDLLWRRLLSQNPTLAWQLMSYPVEYKAIDRDARLYSPIIRRCGDKVCINYNEALLQSGRDQAADDMVSQFRQFLAGFNDEDMIDISLTRGDAVIWWDELFLHARQSVIAGAELRTYRKVGIALKPQPPAQPKGSPLNGDNDPSSDQEAIYATICEEIGKRRRPDTPLVVGIDGISAAGKTHLSAGLQRYLKRTLKQEVGLIHVDDFHFQRSQRYDDDFGSRAFHNKYFNYERLITQLLQPLKTQGYLRRSLTLLNIESDEYTVVRSYEVPRGGVLIIEGTLLFRQQIMSFLDYRIFCDVSVGTSLSRSIERRRGKEWFESVSAKYYQRYMPANMQYRRTVRPQDSADLVIDMTNFRVPKIMTAKASHSEWPL